MTVVQSESLADAPLRDRSPSGDRLTSACPLDCPDSCSLDITVADGRVTKIEGSTRNPVTAGFICSKVAGYSRYLYSDQRIQNPGLRVGPRGSGEFKPISWDEALDRIAEQLDRHRGEAILPFAYGGSNGSLSQDTTDARLFYRLGASRLDRAVCAATTSRVMDVMYGNMPGTALDDYVHAKLIVVWGANPSVTGIHLVPLIKEARSRGAKLVVVDPRRTPLAAKADLHLQVYPGTDGQVALSVIRGLFEEGGADFDFLERHATGWEELRLRAKSWTYERAAAVSGVSASDLQAFTRLYAELSPAVVRCGWGPERNRNGGSSIAGIVALPTVAGKFGVRGGGMTLSNWSTIKVDSSNLVGEPEPETRLLNMNQLGRQLLELDDPPIQCLFVYNANPLATLPEQTKVRAGLEREDLFTVVFDQAMTDTARYADIVLPATTFLEHRELQRGYGSMVVHDIHPVIEPVGESRSNLDVFADLGRRMGLSRPGELETASEMIDDMLSSTGPEFAAKITAERIVLAGNGSRPVQWVDLHPGTADGKILLVPEELDSEAPGGLYTFEDDPATASFPLALISPATNRTISSTLGHLHRKQVCLEMHPDDAGSRGIASGDEVRVWNDLGEVRCLARVARDLAPGVVFLPKGIWSHNTLNGATSNALVPDTLNDVAGGASFNDARVQVEGT